MSRTRLPIVLALLSGLFGSVLLPAVTNVLTSILPEDWLTSLKDRFFEVAAVAIVLAVISVGLLVWQSIPDRSADEVQAGGGTVDTNRDRMLEIVRQTWIDGYLKHSLENLARLELGLETKPDAVSRPYDLLVQPADREARPLPTGIPIGTVFDEVGKAMLILGAPGAGKTTLLLELTRDLLDRAEHDVSHPIPVVFPLSSWAVERRPLADWLADELNKRHGVSKKLARTWIDTDQVLPLLDGLDEVAAEHRAACIEAINAFRQEHGLVPLAVCCRKPDYEALSASMQMSGAIVIQPLSQPQVGAYLEQAGKLLAGVRAVLQDDETLWELLYTPLMLSVAVLAYRGRSTAEVRATGSLEERRGHLFAKYTERMFERPLGRPPSTEYTREQTIHWLIWLARSMMHHNASVLYIEWMQPVWPVSRAQRWIVVMAPFTCWVLLGVLIGGLAFGLTFGLTFGLILGLIFGVAFVLSVGQGITPAETLRWSWIAAGSNLTTYLVVGLVLGLASGLVLGLAGRLASGLAGGLAGGLAKGGDAYIKHYVLRFLLWRNDYVPLHYIRFLDYAAERVFLRKVGGGYIFTHRLLMEYFATLEPTEQAKAKQRQ